MKNSFFLPDNCHFYYLHFKNLIIISHLSFVIFSTKFLYKCGSVLELFFVVILVPSLRHKYFGTLVLSQ